MVYSYKDLKVWDRSVKLVTEIYKLTEIFPEIEKFGLTNQIRRAAVSIPSNISEGSSRRSKGEFIRFINIASGSIAEIETQLLIAINLGYIKVEDIHFINKELDEIGKMLFSLQNSLSKTEMKLIKEN